MVGRRRYLFLLIVSSAVSISLIYLMLRFYVLAETVPYNAVQSNTSILETKQFFAFKDKKVQYKELGKYLGNSDKKVAAAKTVLFWTKYFENYLSPMPEVFHERYLETIGCPTTNCIFTFNRTQLHNVHDFDAILFHPAQPRQNLTDRPENRKPEQVYIMVSHECPSQMWHDLDVDRSFFNLTMTYRLHSDILWNYGAVVDLSTGMQIAPSLDVRWRQRDVSFNDSSILQLAQHKSKTAAWFVSHCDAFSNRDELTKKLRRHIDIDIYGKCGTLQCDKNSSRCSEMLNSTYRFYFAFENTLCRDYITEKVFDSMMNLVIPVIYSGANLSLFLPPHSYINVESFKSVEELATYLEFLSSHPDEYIKYFWWKKYYKVISQTQLDHGRIKLDLCKICQKLNEPNFSAKRQVYENIKDWFYKDMCRNPKIKF